MKETNILYIIDGENSEGLAAELTFSYLSASKEAGEKFRVLVPIQNSFLSKRLKEVGIEEDVLPVPAVSEKGGFFQKIITGFKFFQYYRKLFRFFQMYPFQLVHAVGMKSSLLSIGLKVRFNSPLLWQLDKLIVNPSTKSVTSFLASVFADKVVASCMDVGHQLGRDRRWKGRLSIVYPPFLSPSESRKTADGKDGVVIAAGIFLGETKLEDILIATRTFVRIIELLQRKKPEIKGKIFFYSKVLMGLPESINEILVKTDFIDHEIIENSQMVNFDKSLLKSHAKAYLCFSHRMYGEVSYDLWQAVLAAVPILAMRTPHAAEILTHEKTGILVPFGDADSISGEILRLTSSPELSLKLTKEARNDFELRFGIQTALKQIAKSHARFVRKAEVLGTPHQHASSDSDKKAA